MQQEVVATPHAVSAAVRLLADEDVRVLRACRRRLRAWGEAARPQLEHAAAHADARVRVRARALLRSLDLDAWGRGFRRGVRTAKLDLVPHGVLEAGLRALVGFGWIGVEEPEAFERRIDQLADELAPLVRERSSLTAARRLADVLARRHDMSGARAPASGREDWLPDHVLESGRGPASILAAIYLLVCRRAGVQATGVLLPDFVLVRVHGRRRILVDPYHRGRTVTKADCLRYLRRVLPSRPAAERLSDVDDSEVLDRVLEDLILVHDRPEDGELRDALRRARLELVPGREVGRGEMA